METNRTLFKFKIEIMEIIFWYLSKVSLEESLGLSTLNFKEHFRHKKQLFSYFLIKIFWKKRNFLL